MRGRKPRELTIAARDLPHLEQVARSRHLPWLLVQRARVVLAMAQGQRCEILAWQMDCDRRTIHRICRYYEEGGLERLFVELPRGGHPLEFSPLPTSPDHRSGLSGAHCPRTAHHALEQQ